jgi:hypothetical protein
MRRCQESRCRSAPTRKLGRFFKAEIKRVIALSEP